MSTTTQFEAMPQEEDKLDPEGPELDAMRQQEDLDEHERIGKEDELLKSARIDLLSISNEINTLEKNKTITDDALVSIKSRLVELKLTLKQPDVPHVHPGIRQTVGDAEQALMDTLDADDEQARGQHLEQAKTMLQTAIEEIEDRITP